MISIHTIICTLCRRRGRIYCYYLRIILEVTTKHYPQKLSMTALCREASQGCNRSPDAVYGGLRALNKDIWEYRRNELCELLGRSFDEKPALPDLIYLLTEKLMEDGGSTE